MAKHVWKTKDGQKIPIKELTDEHLRNIIRMLERAHVHYVVGMADCIPDFQGEMAQYYFEMEVNKAVNSSPEDLFPIYTHLVNEQERREREKRRT